MVVQQKSNCVQDERQKVKNKHSLYIGLNNEQLENRGIEPRTSSMLKMHYTTKPIPQVTCPEYATFGL